MTERPRESFPPYHFFVTLPDRLYPFKKKVDGEWVRGIRAYDAELARAFRTYGTEHYGYSLMLYRQFFHLVGSLIVVYAASYISYHFFGSRTTLFFLLAFATLFITYQEFFLQRRIYHQLYKKAVADWAVWVVPMALYLFLFH